MKPRSLRTTLLRSVILLAVGVVVILFGVIFLSLRLIQESIVEQQQLLVSALARQGNQYLSETDRLMRVLSHTLMDVDAPTRDLLLQQTRAAYPRFATLYLLDSQGTVLAEATETRPLLGLDMSGELFFRATQETGQIYFSDPFVSLSSGQASVTVAIPIIDPSSSGFRGALIGELSLDRLQTTIEEIELSEGVLSFITDQQGALIAHPQPEWVQERRNLSTLGLVQAGRKGQPGVQVFYDASQQAWLVGSVMVMDRQWLVMTTQPILLVARPVITFSLAALLFILTLVGFFLYQARSLWQITAPLSILVAHADALARGNYAVALPPTQLGQFAEIVHLGQRFTQMATAVQERDQELEARVTERTQQLAQRVDQLGLINRVGRDATSLLDVQVLLPRLATLIRTTFHYYAVLILMVDEREGQIRLSAASTDEEEDLLGAGMTFALGPGSLIGLAASTGEAIVVNDVTTDARYLYDERLHRTRAELTLPLRIGQQVLGVLDLESTMPNAFGPEEVQVFQTLADQIAITIRNADLFRAAQKARAEAEEASRAKSTFLANMSHELRTPLNSIINFTGFVLDEVFGGLTQEQRKFLTLSLHSSEHLLGLINDILDLSKIEAGKMELFCEEVDLNYVIEAIIITAGGLMRDKNLALTVDIPEPLPPVWADPTRIRQIMLNLLSNAAKFTEKGSICVRGVADDRWVTLQVEDTGIGIAETDIPKVFAEFEQVDGSLTRQVGGTGLGMPISKRFVEMHGGHMWVESTPGVGSRFYFTLPRAESAEVPLPAGLETPRVLVIAGDPAAQEAISNYLIPDYHIVALSDGAALSEVAPSARPDVVVLDVLMSYPDGWQLLQSLRANTTTQDIPVVGCSVLTSEGVVLPLESGGYLAKPLDRHELYQLISHLAPHGGRVLVADDDPMVLEIIQQLLLESPYKLVLASNGRDALDEVALRAPDVMVLDLMMPVMSGFEVLAELRANPQTAYLPVIILTAKTLTADERAFLQAKATLLLQKSQFAPETFRQTIQRVLGHRHQTKPS